MKKAFIMFIEFVKVLTMITCILYLEVIMYFISVSIEYMIDMVFKK